MSTAFNLTAQLNLRGPTNVRNIVSSIRRQLGTISADVNLRIDPAANRNLTQLNSALNTFNTTLRTTQSNVNNTTNALRGLATAIGAINSNGLPRNMTAMATSANRAAQATSRVTTQVEASRNQMEEFGRQSALAIRRFAAFSLSTGIIFGFTNALNKGLKAFVDFDKELVKLQQVTGESAQGLAGLQKTISSLSTGLGVSSSELINVSSTLAQAGLSARDTERALRALALSSLAPSFDDMNKTVEGSIALMRQFGISAGELDQALGSVNAVAAKFAVEASDIIAAIQRTGGVFAAASKGVSEGTQALNEFIAVFTSIRATTRESAETIATGLRTIFTRVQRGETIEALKQYGVNLTDLEGKFVGAYKAVELLSRGLNTIDPRDLRFSQIVEELGGFRQIGKVIPLIQQFATAQQALAVAQRGQGSLAEDAAIAQLSLANQISKVREEFLTLIRDIGGTDTFQTIAKSALGLASALIKVADSVKGIIPVLGVVMAIRGTAALSSYARGFAGGLRGAPRRGAAKGGIIKYARGGDVDVALMPGEAVVYPEAAKRIGTPTLRRMNYADRKKYAKGGGVGVVPGSGNSDSFYTTLPTGSFVIRKKATEAMGVNTINKIASGRQKFSYGGKVQKFAKAGEVKAGKTDGGGGVFMHLDPGPIIKGLFGNNGPKARGLTSIGITLGGIGPEWNQLLKKNKANISREELISLIQNTDPEELFSRQLQRSKNGKKARTGAGTFSGGTLSEAHSALSNQEVQQKLKSAIIDSASRLKYPIQGDKDLYPLGKALVDAAPPIMKKALAEIREYVYTDKSKGRERRKKALEESKTTGKVRRTTSEIRRRFSSKTLKQIQEGGARVVAQRGTNRLSIPRFSKGGITERNVGYIDSDEISGLLKDPVKGPLIKAEMDRLGIKGVADFKEHLSNLAASRRKSGDLKRLTNIFGVAGSGKSTMVQGGSRAKEADNARLRKTTRYPILTEADLLRSDQVIDSTSVAGPSQKNALSSADRIIALSSRTKDSQEILKRQRKARDTSGKNLFGRKPGATKSAPLDSGIGEAYIAASEVSGVDSKKVRTLKIGENFKKTRTNQPSVRTPDKTGLFYGNFGPATAGHADAILEASKKAGIPTKDFVALVGGDTPIDPFSKDPHDRRTALFPQKAEDNRPSRVGMAKSVFGAIGANVSAMPRGSGPGSIPPAFKIGDDNYIVPKGTGDVAVVGDEKDPKSLDKYTKLGYKTMSLPRLGGISGTKAREAIANNDIPSLKKLLTKEGFDYVQQHIQTLQKRPQLIDAILDRIQKNSDKGRGVAGRLSSTKSALSELPSRVTKTTPPEIATKIESLRKDREALSSKLGRLPSKLVSRLEKRQRFGRGSTKPLKSISEMRRSELMDEARSKGISYDYELLGLRRPLTADESARKAKFLKDLEDSRIVTQEQAAKTSARAKKRNIAVVGITGDNDAQEIVTPGIKSKRGKKGMSGVPATLQTGTLPPEIAKKVQAIIRNRSERIVSAVASVIAGAAGTTQVKDRKGIRSILSKQLPDISGLLFESGLAAAGAPYDPSSKAIDFNKGLGKELAGLFGIDPKALTDATNDATQEQARRKVKKGQFDRGRRDAIRAKKGKTPRQKFGKGGLAFTDFDMTAAVSKQKETPSLSGFRNPSLAVPDIMNASPSGLLKLLRQDYGGVGVLTARSGGPKGEMKKALQTFFKKNGIMVPANRLITLGDQIEDVPTPEKKARELHRLVKKYGRIDYFDDREDIVGAAKEVKGVNARRIKLRRAIGGSIPSPMNNASLSRSSKDKRLDPKKLAAFLGSETPITKKQEELLKQLKDKTSVISKPNYEELLKGLDPKKYARGGEVPIMAKEGEYIINRQSARAIGYDNLHGLNKYHSGGVVQKLAKGSTGPLASRTLSGLEDDAAKLKMTLKQLLNAFKANRDKFYEQERASGKSKSQASRAADERTAKAYRSTFKTRTGSDTTADVSRSSVGQLQKSGYLKQYDTKAPKGISSSKIATLEKDIGRVFGGLEDTLDKLVNAGERQSKKLKAQVNARARQAADTARQSALSAGRSDDEADQDARNAYNQTRRSGMKDVAKKVRSRQAARDARLEQLGVQTTDATGKRLSRKQIKENSSRALDANKKLVENRQESLVRSRFKSLKQDNPGIFSGAVSNSGLGRTINRGYRAVTGRDLPTKRTDASLMAQARKEVEKILQLETRRAQETAKQLANERAKTNASSKAKQNAAAQAAAGGAPVPAGGGGGGGGGRRRGSSGAGSPQGGGNPNGRIMGMGRLTQAGFGISMMGGLGSQFFNPESSASNAANAAFTESFTSTIGMGATVAGSIGDLFGGGGGDDDNNKKKKKRPKGGSRNRGPSTPTRPPASPPSGGGGSRGGSGGGGRRGGAPRVPAGGGSGGGGGTMGMLGGVGGVLAGVAVVGLAVAEGLKAAHNAAREFAINLANTKLEESLEKANKSIEKFSNNLNDKGAQAKAKNDTLAAVQAADALNSASSTAEAGLFNLTDAMAGGEGSFERSQILNKKGIGAYLSTTSLFGGAEASDNQASQFQTLIPQLASERSKRYVGSAETSASFLESKIRSGSTIEQMKKENPVEFDNLTKSLALADAAVQEQIMSIQNSTSMSEKEKKDTIASITTIESERKAREIQTKALRDKALENLNKTTNRLQNSLERMFQNMDQAINANIASLDKLSAEAELTTASLSGQAKIGTNLKLDSINILDNPRAYDTKSNQMAVSQASSVFGAEANKMSGLLQLGNKLEGSLMATINSTLKENKGSTNESVGAKLDNVITNALSELKIPDDVALNLGKEMSTAIQEMRKKGEDKVDFSELTERIPQLSKVVESSKRAHEIAKRALEQWQGAVNEYAAAINQITEMQVEASMRSRRANSILIQGQNDLQKALGKEISLRDSKNNTLQGFSDQTGGLSDPRAIGRNIRNLEGVRSEQQSLFNAASNKGPGAAGEVKMMGDELLKTNFALRENYDALKNMADNTDIASAALNKISEIRQQRQAGVGFAEKLVSSTPRELANLNMSMARLQNNMAGRMNMSTPNQRAGDLQLFNELAPLLGDKQSEMKANVLESMLKESGVGVSPMMQEVIDSLRNPEADPAMQEAIATYKEGVAMQSMANDELSKISLLMSNNNADIAAQKLTQSLAGVTLNFDSARLNDINQGIQLLLAEVKAHNGAGMSGAPVSGKARGGLIYASTGTLVDFKPQGTDTVPAMLTPGEFVVNKKSTQKNLGLLKQINNGGYSSGGQVKYYADGGYVFGKDWSPRKDDKETGDEAQKRASGRYDGDSYNETKNYLPDLNWDEVKKGVLLEKYWALHKPPVYAVNSGPGMISKDWITSTNEEDINSTQINTAGLSWNPGIGYKSFSLVEGGVTGLGDSLLALQNVQRVADTNSWQDFNVPTHEWLSLAAQPGSERKKIRENQAEDWFNDINSAYQVIKKYSTTDQGDFFEINGKKLYKDFNKLLPQDKPPIEIKLIKQAKAYSTPDSDTGKVIFNKIRQIQVSGLAENSAVDGYGLLLNPSQKTVVNKSRDKGNFISARQDLSSGQMAAEAPTLGAVSLFRMAADATSATENTSTGGSLSTAITAGETASSNLGFEPVNNFGKLMAKYIKPFSLGSVASKSAENISTLSMVSAVREKMKIALEQLQDPNSFTKSGESTANQDYARKLQALAEGIVFNQMFSENELKPAKGAGPYTLYNMTSPDDIEFWKMATKAAEQSGGADKGSYAATEADFIDIFKSDIGGGLTKIKSFPWVNSGFRDMSFLNKKEEQRNKDQTQAAIKVANAFFKGKYLSFPYKKIVSKLWSREKQRFDGAEEKFDIVDAGGVFDKNNPNPLNELLLPNFSSIRTDNAAAIGQILDAQALANQGNKFSLKDTNAFVAARMDPSSREISASGIIDPKMKENIYVRGDATLKPDWMTPVFAELYKTKAARAEQEQNAEVAGKAGSTDEFKGTLTSAHRTSLARILHKVAVKNRVGMVGPIPTKKEDIYKNIDLLGRTASMPRANTEVVARANAARSLFSTILNDQGGKLQTWISTTGFDLNNVFDKDQNNIKNEVKRKLAQPGMMGKQLTTVYYQFKKEAQDKLSGLFQTLLDSESGGMKFRQFSSQNKLSEDTQASLKLEGAQEASRDSKGNLVYKSLKENIPKTYQEVANFSLNPYNRFPNNTARGTYLDKLSEVVMMGKDKNNRPLYTGKMKTKILEDLLNLKTFYTATTGSFKGLDYYTNTGMKPADAMKELESTPKILDDYNALLEKTTKSHLFLTQNAMGKLPTYDQFSKIIADNKTRDESKVEKPQAVSKGGVIYASTGTLVDYQPRGTDTVPAMLTPGEFVVNRAATQKHLPLLKAINNGSKNPQAFSKGGIAYLESGGLAALEGSFASLSSWYPDASRIEQIKTETSNKNNELSKQKQKDRECIEKIYAEERTKQQKRLDATNSDEYREQVEKSKTEQLESMDKRRQIYADIKRIQDSFYAQFREDVAKVKAETGLKTLEEVFDKFPRLKMEHEFTKQKGDISKLNSPRDMDRSVKDFKDNLVAILNTIKNDTGTFASVDSIKNMYDIKAFGSKATTVAPPKALSENKGRNKEDIKKAIEECKAGAVTAQAKQFGGIIYANKGTLVNYQPRGTDTVPAMLTPGEFVVNRNATQKNLPLLQSINSGNYQRGGVVIPHYRDMGGILSGASKVAGAVAGAVGIKLDTKNLEQELNKVFNNGAKQLAGLFGLSSEDKTTLTTFGNNLSSLFSQISQINLPPEIRFSMQPVQVNITGAQGLTDAAESLVNGAIKKAFDDFLSINDLQGTYKPPGK